MNYQNNLEHSGKIFSDRCVISENKRTSQGRIKWCILNQEVKKHLECAKKPVRSTTFSVGSHSFYLNFLLKIIENEPDSPAYLKMILVNMIFNNKLPDSAWIKGTIHFDELDINVTFSVSGQTFQKILEIPIPCNYSEFEKLICICESGLNLTMNCLVKITVKDVKCAIDKDINSYVESRNYDSNSETFKNDFSDVSISIGDHLFMTHKSLLVQIPYFQELFDANELEKRFELTNIDHEIFNHVLTYLYSGEIPKLSIKLACELYIVASDLKIPHLKALCSSYLGANLTDINVVVVLKLSYEYEDSALETECFKFIKRADPETLAKQTVVL